MSEKLFVFYVGGMNEHCHVELHDVRFSVGTTPEDCWNDLCEQWWGTLDSFHLDAWGALDQVDGYDILLDDAEDDNAELTDFSLWFVNLGGYDKNQFTELHENVFVMAKDAREAKQSALTRIQDWYSPHKDNVIEVETIINVSRSLSKRGRKLKFAKAKAEKPFTFEAKYVPVGKMVRH